MQFCCLIWELQLLRLFFMNGHTRIPTSFLVFASFLSNPDELPLQDEDGFGFMGFNAHLQENEGLRLQVFGNCACMGPEWPGDLIHGVENEFAEYHLHNADTQAQRVSLYAGLGHLASLAAQRTD
jgi:hypothetical protein